MFIILRSRWLPRSQENEENSGPVSENSGLPPKFLERVPICDNEAFFRSYSARTTHARRPPTGGATQRTSVQKQGRLQSYEYRRGAACILHIHTCEVRMHTRLAVHEMTTLGEEGGGVPGTGLAAPDTTQQQQQQQRVAVFVDVEVRETRQGASYKQQ